MRHNRGYSGRRKHLLFRAAFWFLLTLASLLLVFPSLANAAAGIRQVTEMRSFTDVSGGMEEEYKKEMFRAAESYNRGVFREQQQRPFSYRGEHANDPLYASLLSEGEDGIIGILEIPAIGACLPVAHGTSETILRYECGHMYGTSLPTGGESTHAVIAAHTGLTTAELFTHLTDMKKGDRFSMHLPGCVHTYETSEIRIVLPEEESRYLQVREGEDLITLYTCTPYGINDHRLLVTGKRVLPDPEGDTEGGEILNVESFGRSAVEKTVLLASIPSLLSVAGAVSVLNGFRERRRHQDERRRSV